MTDDSTPTPPRRSIPRRLRFEILRRDAYRCKYCGGQSPDVTLVVDHVIPVALGGGDDPTNLVTACFDCNSGKGSTSPDEHVVEEVTQDALRWAAAAAKAADMRRAELGQLEEQLGHFYNQWTKVFGSDMELSRDWESSIATFIRRGLVSDDLTGFIYATAGKRVTWSQAFRYFCGCCWRELGNRDELARQLIENGDA